MTSAEHRLTKQDLIRRSPFLWEIPVTHRNDMRVPVRIFADDKLVESALLDSSLEQAVNASTLPGLVSHVTVMPDVHQGYGFPIGGVAATLLPDGIISPGAIGYDINCGVRLLASTIPFPVAQPHLGALASALYANCPSGVGVKGSLPLTSKEIDRVCREGARWADRSGYAQDGDLEATEEQGCID